MHLKNHWKL